MQFGKSISLFIVVLLLAITVLPTVAAANGWQFWKNEGNYKEELNEIQISLDSLESDSVKMEFIYKNMDDIGIDVVKTEIVKNDGKALKTFYVVRGEGIIEEGEVSEKIANDKSIVTFKPTIRQAKLGLDLIQDKKLTIGEIIRGTMLYRMVEKENEPPIDEVISKLDTEELDSYLPIPIQRIQRMLN